MSDEIYFILFELCLFQALLRLQVTQPIIMCSPHRHSDIYNFSVSDKRQVTWRQKIFRQIAELHIQKSCSFGAKRRVILQETREILAVQILTFSRSFDAIKFGR